MNKQLFEMTNKMGKIVMNYPIDDESDIDIVAFKMLRNDCPSFIAGFSSVEINGKITLRYDVGNMISLAYYSAKLSKNEFTTLWNNLLEPLMQCKDWLLAYNSFCFDPQYVFVDRNTMAIKYIYLPINSATVNDDEIKEMFVGIMDRCEMINGQDLQVELYKLFAQRSFSLGNLHELIIQHASAFSALTKKTTPTNSVVETPYIKQDAPSKNTEKAEVTPYKVEEVLKTKNSPLTLEEELEKQIIESMSKKQNKTSKESKPEKIKPEKKPLFSFGKKASKVETKESLLQINQPYVSQSLQQNNSAYPLKAMQMEDDNTVMIDDAEDISVATLRLINMNIASDIPRMFILDFSRGGVSVGRHDSGKGIRQHGVEFPSTAKSVSRMHARIEQVANGYLLIDLGSGNGTFLNGIRISSNIPVAIKNGDCIGFSDKGIDYILSI